jgi:lipopolysaccharide transport protein LptA/LPS export ABC transporter protein LptC
MAIATDSNGRLLSAEPAAVAWSADADRERAFAAARRHSFIVRWLKIILPVCAAAVLSSYAVFMQRSISVNVGAGNLELGPIAFSSEVLTMHNPRYEGYSKDGSRFIVSARAAEQKVAGEGPIKLKTIEGSIVQPNKTTTTLQAASGLFDTEASELELLDSIEIKSSDGMVAQLSRAKIFMKESRIVSDDPVTVEMPTGTLKGNSMILLQKTRELTFDGGVTAQLKPQSRPKQNSNDGAQPQSMASVIASGDGPINVTAPKLTIDDAQKIALFTGNVRVEQDGAVLTARELEIAYDGSSPAEGGGAAAVPTATAGSVKRIFARDNVIITRGADRVTSATAEFDTAAETSILAGAVEFTSGADRRAVADRAVLDFKSDTALLTGVVTISQGPNILMGRHLFVDHRNGTMRLSAPTGAGAPQGRISAYFKQPEGRSAPAKSTPNGQAGSWQFRTDPNAPIEIEADVLEVDDKANTATFRGDVHVVQGEFSLRTVELVATYSGQAGAGLMQPADSNASAPAAQLERVRAHRKVVVTSKDDQSATGDWADFNLKTNKVVLGGDVTLTQGRNVVRGPRLVIDMTTGQSRMETAKAGAQAATPSTGDPAAERGTNAPGAKGWPAGACGGRMCAVFYPKDVEALAKRHKAESPTGSRAGQPESKAPPAPQRGPQGEAASSWSSTTIPAGAAE